MDEYYINIRIRRTNRSITPIEVQAVKKALEKQLASWNTIEWKLKLMKVMKEP